MSVDIYSYRLALNKFCRDMFKALYVKIVLLIDHVF